MSATYQKVIRGRGSLARIQQMTEKAGISRPLVIGSDQLTGKLLKKVPAIQTSPVFSGYHSNPDLLDALPAAEVFRANGCDGIISIGGGSAIDTGKAVKALLYAGTPEKALRNSFPENMDIPHIAIPGTAGSGAEATQNAVTFYENRKTSLSHPDLRPDSVILDGELLETLPVYYKKSAALDALCQGIESYWCRNSTEDSRIHAYLAILGVLDNLKAYLAGDLHAADEMLDAAYQSGRAIQITGTTAAHAMAYQVTKTLGCAHGHACMITLPVLWEEAAKNAEVKKNLQDLASKMRLSDQQMVPHLLRGILYGLEMEIPAMPDETTFRNLISSVNPERLRNHPVAMTATEVEKVYRKAFQPLCPAEKQACSDIWKYFGE